MLRVKRIYLLPLLLLLSFGASAQCPQNIGFEDGTFNGWKCYAGTCSGGNLILTPTAPIEGRHTLLKNTSPQALDPYGGFPVNSPNGSDYTLMLGNSQAGAQAERVTYEFTVPNNRYTVTYYYAVVMNNPGHPPAEQPTFTAEVDDITTGTPATGVYKSSLDCGNHSFVASAGQPGFVSLGSGANIVQYKPWSPVNLTLIGYAGHTLRFSFTTTDCTRNQHFGYAYLDFEENCASPIKGNNYCLGTSEVVLTAPPGFASYAWYNEDFSTQLGNKSTLEINPIPPDGSKYALIVDPPAGLGCRDTLYTTVSGVSQVFKLNVLTEKSGCKADGIDLTDASITAGSSADMKFEYYQDADGQIYLSDPKRVTASGTYYIRGTNTVYACTDIKPIKLTLYDGPVITTKDPTPVCTPSTVDITLPSITKAADLSTTIAYFTDALGTIPLPNPKAINKTGTYYVKGTSAIASCTTILPIRVIVSDIPVATPKEVKDCPPINLYNALGNEPTSIHIYNDAAGTQEMPATDVSNITIGGRYYYRLNNIYGCVGNLSTIDVTVYKVPYFTVTDPKPVTFPATINLADTRGPDQPSVVFTYWTDAAATQKLDNYQSIGVSGTFYIKSKGEGECTVIHPVHVLVNAPPEADLIFKNTFSPNGDGINDFFEPTTTGVLSINYLKIYNRYGKQIYQTNQALLPWDGNYEGRPQPSGTYYWIFSCYDLYRKKSFMRSGSITIIR